MCVGRRIKSITPQSTHEAHTPAIMALVPFNFNHVGDSDAAGTTAIPEAPPRRLEMRHAVRLCGLAILVVAPKVPAVAKVACVYAVECGLHRLVARCSGEQQQQQQPKPWSGAVGAVDVVDEVVRAAVHMGIMAYLAFRRLSPFMFLLAAVLLYRLFGVLEAVHAAARTAAAAAGGEDDPNELPRTDAFRGLSLVIASAFDGLLPGPSAAAMLAAAVTSACR